MQLFIFELIKIFFQAEKGLVVMFQPADMNNFIKGLVVTPWVQSTPTNLKKVQDLSTEDFIKASNNSPDTYADLAKLVQIIVESETNSAKLIFTIQHVEANVTLVCDDDHPFYVFCSGWSSLSPLLTKVKYSLSCKTLTVGDFCLVLRRRCEKTSKVAPEQDLIVTVDDENEHIEQPLDLSRRLNAQFEQRL